MEATELRLFCPSHAALLPHKTPKTTSLPPHTQGIYRRHYLKQGNRLNGGPAGSELFLSQYFLSKCGFYTEALRAKTGFESMKTV